MFDITIQSHEFSRSISFRILILCGLVLTHADNRHKSSVKICVFCGNQEFSLFSENH
jgi:hypothetical protein